MEWSTDAKYGKIPFMSTEIDKTRLRFWAESCAKLFAVSAFVYWWARLTKQHLSDLGPVTPIAVLGAYYASRIADRLSTKIGLENGAVESNITMGKNGEGFNSSMRFFLEFVAIPSMVFFEPEAGLGISAGFAALVIQNVLELRKLSQHEVS